MAVKFTKKQIKSVDGGGTALVLCGYGPFGDCQSIRHRLSAARARIAELSRLLSEFSPTLPSNADITLIWEQDLKVWEYAVVQGEKLLARELKKVAAKYLKQEDQS